MPDPQTFANQVRELVFEREVLRRLGIEVIRASADHRQLSVRARAARQLLQFERRDNRWLDDSPAALADEIVREFVAHVQSGGLRIQDARLR